MVCILSSVPSCAPSLHRRTDQDAKLEALQASVRAGLRQRGATADVATYVEGVLREQHEEHRRSMANEGDLRRALQQYVAELEVGVLITGCHMTVQETCSCCARLIKIHVQKLPSHFREAFIVSTVLGCM